MEEIFWQQYIVIKFSLDIEKLLWAHSEFPGVGSNIGLLAFVIDWVWSLSVRRISVAEQYLQFRNVWNASEATANVFVSDEVLEYECLFLHIKVGWSKKEISSKRQLLDIRIVSFDFV